MALADDLSTALKEAMKAKDKPKLDAIRQIQTEIAKKKSEKGEEVNDELVLGVISSWLPAVDSFKYYITFLIIISHNKSLNFKT